MMSPAKALDANGMTGWIQLASTAGVGAAFGAAALYILVNYSLAPNLMERTKLTDTLTELVKNQSATNMKLGESLDTMAQAQAKRDLLLEQQSQIMVEQLGEINKNGLGIVQMNQQMQEANKLMAPAVQQRKEFHDEVMKIDQEQVELLKKLVPPNR